MSKSVYKLVGDIRELMSGPHVPDDSNLEEFKEHCAKAILSTLSKSEQAKGFHLRASNIGTGERKLWYQARDKDFSSLSMEDELKFLFGHLLEAVLILLIKEAGHTVSNAQDDLEVNGVKGHSDGVLNGVIPNDIKSASSFSFPKFSRGTLLDDDSFGYGWQMKFYKEALEKLNDTEYDEVSWLAIDKQYGKLALMTADADELPEQSVSDRIDHLNKSLASQEPPERCYPVTVHDNGDEEIHKNCYYCKYKLDCWGRLRTFKYAQKDRHFTKVVGKKTVEEITDV